MSTFLQILERDGLPSSIHTEKVVLGAMLSDPVAVIEAIETLIPGDFFLDSHQRIYAAMLQLVKDGVQIDFVTVGESLLKRKELQPIGGRPYLISLTEDIPRHLSVTNYARTLKEKGILRRLIGVCQRGLERSIDTSQGADDVQTFLTQELADVALTTGDTAMEHISEFANKRYPERDSIFEVPAKSKGLPTGLAALDQLTLGLHRGELIILAGRPSMGKTALVTTLIGLFAPRQVRAAVFALEQGKESMLKRVACGRARASFKDLRAGTSSDMDKRYIAEELDKIKASSIYWSDATNTTISKIRARALRKDREIKETMGPDDGLDVIIIDQLSWVSHDDLDSGKRTDERLGEIARGGKALAKELNIPVILVCQLGRPNTQTAEVREPRMSDLAESGKLEQHADVVMFVHRPEYYNRTDDTLKGKGVIIVDKNRDGDTGRVEMVYTGSCTLWSDAPLSGQIDWDRIRNTPPDYTSPPTSAYEETK